MRGDKADGLLLLGEQALQHGVGIAPAADQIPDGRERRHPQRALLRHAEQYALREVGPVLDGVHPRLQGRRNGAVAVRMRHNGKSSRMGQLDHPADVLRLRARLRQDAEVVKIDEAGDHELDEVRPLLPCLVQQGAVFVLRVEAAADEGPIVPAAVDGKGWTAVIDAVFPRQLPRPQADAPGSGNSVQWT